MLTVQLGLKHTHPVGAHNPSPIAVYLPLRPQLLNFEKKHEMMGPGLTIGAGGAFVLVNAGLDGEIRDLASSTPFAAQIRRVFTHFGTSESIVVNLQS